MPKCYICVISLHILKYHVPIWGKNWVKTDAWCSHKCNHAFSLDQSKVWCLKYQQCIIRKKEKIRLESTHTDILLIKLKKKINFQLVCKLTHAYIFINSTIKRLTYMYANFHTRSMHKDDHIHTLRQLFRQIACTIRVSVKIMSNTLIEFPQNSSKRKALPLSWQIKVAHLSP